MNKIRKRVVSGLVFPMILFSHAALADRVVRSMDLDGLTREALEKSPGLKAKKAEYEALRSKAIRAWLPDDPEFGIDVEGQPDLFRFNQRTDNEYMAVQTIPFPTKLFLRGLIASKEADIAYQRYKEEERQAVWHIEEPYYELYTSQKTLAILKDNQTLLEQLTKSAQTRYESNQASQQDLLKAQIESEKNAVELFNTEQKIRLQQAHFAHILNESLHTAYEIPADEDPRKFEYRLEDLEKMALDKRAELKALELGLDRARSSSALAHTEWLPDITLRYEGRQFRGDNRVSENDTFIGVTVPVWSLVKGIGGVWRGADQEVAVAEQAYLKMKNEVLLSVHEAFSKIKSSENALNVYDEKILPQAKQQVALALASYEAGKAGFLEVVDAQRTLRSVQTDYYGYWAQYRQGIADLALAVGTSLDRGIH